MFKLRARLQQLVDRISLQEVPDIKESFDLDEADLFNLNIGQRGNNMFLGYYSQRGLEIAMEKYKVTQKLRRKGFNNLKLKIDTSDPYKHSMMLNNHIENRIEKLVEFVVKRDFLDVDMPFKTDLNGKKYEVLIVEWLKMQNPRVDFPEKKPRLPGQEYPGLGVGSDALEMLVFAARRLGMKGIVNIPDHYHNAFFYSRLFLFEKPEDQARLMAIIRDTRGKTIKEVAWAIEEEKLIDRKLNKPFKWEIAKQILPLENKWRKLYTSWNYKNMVFKKRKDYKFKLLD